MAEIERQLAPHSNEAADLILRKGELAIAVEISITTTVDHEFGNVRKCLAAGFTHVAVVSPKAGQLSAIAAAVKAGLSPKQAALVSFHSPEEFITMLPVLARHPGEPAPAVETVVRGYRVKREGHALTPEERRAKEEAAIRVMAESMKRQK
jgi:hypothetical protein